MSIHETTEHLNESKQETNEITRQQDLMNRVINALTMSDEMKEELQVDPTTLKIIR